MKIIYDPRATAMCPLSPEDLTEEFICAVERAMRAVIKTKEGRAFIEAQSRLIEEYVRLHLSDGTTLVTLFRLKNMESQLQPSQFMRVHRSYIINLSYVAGFTKGRVYISDDDYVPIGDNYKEQFLNYINNSQ